MSDRPDSAIDYKPISDYGVIGDMHSAALVGLDGSIDWYCAPRFDSPSVFAALLDARIGGRFQLSPIESFRTNQSYEGETNVLSTIFESKHDSRYAVRPETSPPGLLRKTSLSSLPLAVNGSLFESTTNLKADSSIELSSLRS